MRVLLPCNNIFPAIK